MTTPIRAVCRVRHLAPPVLQFIYQTKLFFYLPIGTSLELMIKLIAMLQNKFKVSFENITWNKRGSLTKNGKWTGVISDLLEDRIDLGMKKHLILFYSASIQK